MENIKKYQVGSDWYASKSMAKKHFKYLLGFAKIGMYGENTNFWNIWKPLYDKGFHKEIKNFIVEKDKNHKLKDILVEDIEGNIEKWIWFSLP